MSQINDSNEYERTGLEVAVIGMAGRFPGAGNIEEFWENLKNSVEAISFLIEDELKEVGVPASEYKEPGYVPGKGCLEEAGFFDSTFFGYTPRESELMDPQMRLFYECLWTVLEDAACNPDDYDGLIGVFAGGTTNLFWEYKSFVGATDSDLFANTHLSNIDFLSTRMAHRLDLKGPAITFQTACSTALVAVDMACRKLLTGQCDTALAGGVSMPSIGNRGYTYEEGMIHSPDGHCRAFDARAHGVVFSDGVGAVALKRLDDAVDDGDSIYAVIKGTASNNDGIRKNSFSAPCVYGQADVIRAAHRTAEVNPETITYVECHGTGTVLGDPIEVEALRLAFNTDKRNYCGIGSVKTNVGHMDTAAGMGGFIKAVLSLKHRMIPSSLHFETPNPKIDFDNSPFYVNTSLKQWENNNGPLRAGVSSFGVGGTNAHVVLEEAPEPEPVSQSRTLQMIMLSAKTPKALGRAAENLKHHLEKNSTINLADVAYTLQVGRKDFKHRRMLVSAAVEDTVKQLADPDEALTQTFMARDENRIVFMFSGQGAQYVNMGLDLYQKEPVFAGEMDRCFKILKPVMGYDVKEILYPPQGGSESSGPGINQTEVAQPVLFAVEYALAKLLMEWGIEPFAMIGHSIGEFTAACLAGVFSLEDALGLVALRGKLMQGMPTGSMLSVTLPEEELAPLLKSHTELSLAAVNAPSLCVVSGPHEAIGTFAEELEEKSHQVRRLHTSHAFHSKSMDPILKEFEAAAAKVTLNEPRGPYISNVTGEWITVEEATGPAYWAKHLRGTVRFADGLTELLKEENSVYLEVGPGKVLSTFARQHSDKRPDHQVLNLVRHPKEEQPDDYYLLNKIGQLWLYGKAPDWRKFYAGEKRHRLHLPAYSFERQPYSIISDLLKEGGMQRFAPGENLHKRDDLSQWFYTPSWKRSTTASPETGDAPARLNWLVFMDDCGIGSQLLEQLKGEKDTATVVRTGDRFDNPPGDQYTVNPAREEDYQALIKELVSQKKTPNRVLHLWNVTKDGNGGPLLEQNDLHQDLTFYSLLYLARAIGEQGIDENLHLVVVTNQMQEVTGEEKVCPWKATIQGPVMVIPREYPNIKCCSADILLPEPGGRQEKVLIHQLGEEIIATPADPIIAFRGKYRLVKNFEPVAMKPVDEKVPRLREKGVYLVTGGLGGIGLEIAKHLAEKARARLILTGRSFFPTREEWEEWLITHPEADRVSRRIRKVQELESLGAEVLAFSVDVTDLQEMQAVTDKAHDKFGTVNGVIHAAGVPGGGVIQLKTREMAENVLAPKVKGTLVLNTLLKDNDLDFFMLCSSINSVISVFGQVDYFAANAFLDAFAFYKTTADDTFTVSINWDAWQEVGMAVAAAKKALDGPGHLNYQNPAVPHPLLDRFIPADEPEPSKLGIYITNFRLDKHWMLNEHVVRESEKGLLPGVTYIEMALAALRNYSDSQAVEVRDVFFQNPLMVAEDEEKEVWLFLRKQEEEYEFLIKSRVDPAEDTWQTHAIGKMAVREKEEPRVYDIREIETANILRDKEDAIIVRTRDEEGNVPAPTGEAQEQGLLVFGPRWDNVMYIKYSNSTWQGLALHELPEEYDEDVEKYVLYPALLDSATGSMFGFVYPGSAYIPFSYKRLRVYRPLVRKLYSYCRVIEKSEMEKEFLKFDVTIMDENGVTLAEIEEFTMLEVSEGIKGRIKEKESVVVEESNEEQETEAMDLLRDGILPEEGIEAFDRILGGALPQVVVSTTDLPLRIRSQDTPDSGEPGSDAEGLLPGGPLHLRPEISTPYVAPGSEVEQKMAEIWGELLGIQQVGILDDFFELGGDSLKATIMITKIHERLNVKLNMTEIFKDPNIKKLSRVIKGSDKDTFYSIEPAPENEYYAVSSLQKRLYIVSKIEKVSTAYNLSGVMIVEGKLEVPRFEQAFVSLVKRHESLRTSFDMRDGEPVQIIHNDIDFHLRYFQKESVSVEDKDEVHTIIGQFMAPFDLAKAPLLRVGLVKLSEEDRHLLLFDIHHIISDGTSIGILIKEVITLYEEREVPDLRIQYKDFAEWQNSEAGRAAVEKQEKYWLDQFKGEIPRLTIYTDYERPAVQSFEGDITIFSFEKDIMQKLEQLMKNTGTTLYMVLLAIYNVLLAMYSGQEDIIVGSPTAGRNHADFENLIGAFINALPMRNYPTADITFEAFLNEVRENTLKAYENQGYLFGDLIEKLGVGKDLSRNPLFDAELVVQNWELPSMDLGYLRFISYEYDAGVTQVDLGLYVMESEDVIGFALHYCTKLFKKETIDRLTVSFKEIAAGVLADPGIKLKDIRISHDLEAASTKVFADEESEFEF